MDAADRFVLPNDMLNNSEEIILDFVVDWRS